MEYRIVNSLRLLQARLERPADYVLNNLDFHGMGLDGIPGWVFREADDRLSIVPMSRLEEKALVPLIMIEGTRLLASGYSYFFDSDIDARFRTAAVGVYCDVLAVAGDWNEATRSRFQVEASRLFKVDPVFNSASLPSASGTQ